MKILSYIFLFLLVASKCFATIQTDSILLISAAPSANAVSGSFVETITSQGNYLAIINSNAVLVFSIGIDGNYNYLNIYNGTGAVLRLTNSILLIDAAPTPSAVDGAWIEPISGQGNYLNIYNGTIPNLIPSWFEANANFVTIQNNHIGATKWQPGVDFAPGAEFWNESIVLIRLIGRNSDIIVFDDF